MPPHLEFYIDPSPVCDKDQRLSILHHKKLWEKGFKQKMTFKGTCSLLDNSDHMTFSIDFCFGTYVSRISRGAKMGKPVKPLGLP